MKHKLWVIICSATNGEHGDQWSWTRGADAAKTAICEMLSASNNTGRDMVAISDVIDAIKEMP